MGFIQNEEFGGSEKAMIWTRNKVDHTPDIPDDALCALAVGWELNTGPSVSAYRYTWGRWNKKKKSWDYLDEIHPLTTVLFYSILEEPK